VDLTYAQQQECPAQACHHDNLRLSAASKKKKKSKQSKKRTKDNPSSIVSCSGLHPYSDRFVVLPFVAKEMARLWTVVILVFIMLRSLHNNEGVEALHFRVPKEGQSYDTSEMVFLFERAVGLCVDVCICASVRAFTSAHRLRSNYSHWQYLKA
jgi:hypothetical protein